MKPLVILVAVCMSTLGLGQVVCGLSTTVVGLAAGFGFGLRAAAFSTGATAAVSTATPKRASSTST